MVLTEPIKSANSGHRPGACLMPDVTAEALKERRSLLAQHSNIDFDVFAVPRAHLSNHFFEQVSVQAATQTAV